jgi:ABC-type branched-subunit amino acid transport system ATPase component/branched-subunit amino acid ABC-type transport system permease component
VWVTYALLGLGLGAMYSLASQGLLLIYRGSGVLNFAQGAIGVVGAYVEYELAVSNGVPTVLAIIIGVAVSGAIGALVHLLIMRQLRRASPLARIVATLGVLITIQALLLQLYGATVKFAPSALPTNTIHFGGTVSVSVDRFLLVGIALALTIGLWAMYKYTKFGIGTSAVAENQRAASTLGWSPDVIATVNWVLGSALAGLAAILVSPLVTLQVTILTNLVLAALAAALVASFTSFPIAFISSIVIGVVETELTSYVAQPGIAQSVPFIVIIAVVILRGQPLPLRDFFLQRLPQIGDGRVRPGSLIGVIIATVLLIMFTNAGWQTAFIISMATALILLSIVVVTGYTGQLSLAQFTIAGFGAWVAGRLVAGAGVPFGLAAIIGVLATIPLGIIFVIPAARTRGINFAVVTLGLGSTLELILFDNGDYTGGIAGTQIGNPTIFGLDVNAVTEPARYAIMCLVVLVIAGLAVTNVRRGRSGRRLIAVRTNERAAAALGVNVRLAKIYAFGLSAAIAAAGGILLAFSNSTITYTSFMNSESINNVGWAMIGGIGYVLGPIFGSTLAPGGVGAQIFFQITTGLGNWITLIGGVSVILLVILNQDGIAKENGKMVLALGAKLSKRGLSAFKPRPPKATVLPEATPVRVPERRLDVEGLTVRYGPTVAVDDVSLSVVPGRVLGLIGPNGAGKTTFIDAVTGFTRPTAGRLVYEGAEIGEMSVTKRARQGISRSFQSLELFEDSTVVDNIAVASDPRDLLSYVRDIVYPIQPQLSSESVAAVREFGLEGDLDRKVQDLSYGKRRLLAIARAVATQPSVLLLDEPAAGLGDAETVELARLIRRLASDWGMAILLIEHDMNFVMNVCDEIVVLDFGRKIGHGTPSEIRNHPEVIAAYLGGGDVNEALEAAEILEDSGAPRVLSEEA